MSVFVKGGFSLSYDKKSSFTNIATDYISSRIKRLSRSYGFRYRTFISVDYTSYQFYLSRESLDQVLPRVFAIFMDPEAIKDQELDYLKEGSTQRVLLNINRRSIKYPLISYFASRYSIYNAGRDGFIEDISSISEREFNDFIKCYFSANNIIVSFTGVKEKELPIQDARSYRPCFKNEHFYVNAIDKIGDNSVTDFSYYPSTRSGYIARMGFLSSACKGNSILYDVIAEIISRDDRIRSITESLDVQSNCYNRVGTLDLVFSGDNTNFSAGYFIQEISSLSKRLEEQDLKLAKEQILEDYYKKINDKASFSYLLARTQLLYGDHEKLMDYPKELEKIELKDIKRVLTNLSSSKYVYLFMKMGK